LPAVRHAIVDLIWRPLFAIADVAGEPWPKRVREIAAAADKATAERSVSVLLLQDIRWIFDGRPATDNDGGIVLRGIKSDRISSADLVSQLVSIEGRPWAEWKGGREITQNGLARVLAKFEIIIGYNPPAHRTDRQGLLPFIL
jgi:hypothetical protein